MRPDIQKKIWDREQIRRIQFGDSANRRRLDTVFYAIKQRATQSSENVRVLNVGIGNGYLETQLLSKGFDAYSLDPSENAVKAVRKQLGASPEKFRVGTAAAMPFESSWFDFVVMSEVIEHLDEKTLGDTFSELKRVLRPGGWFVGTCPDNEDLETHSFTCPYCGKRSHRVGHVHSFTSSSLRALLASHFEVEECRTFLGMNLNWKGLLYHHYVDLPFKLVRLFRPRIRVPHQIRFHILFVAANGAGYPAR